MSNSDVLNNGGASDCIDMTVLQKLSQLMGPVFDQLVPSYLEASDKCFSEVRGLIEHQNLEEAERLFHSLKSSSRNMGANQLGDYAEVLETSMREHQPDRVQPALDEAEQMYQQVRQMLLDYQDSLH